MGSLTKEKQIEFSRRKKLPNRNFEK